MKSHKIGQFDNRHLMSLTICLFGILPVSNSEAQFTDVSEALGFSGGGKAAFSDYDGDGWVDLFAGQLFHNDQGKRLTPVAQSGLPGGEAIWGDFDNDGRPDLFFFTGNGGLYRNTGGGKFEQVDFPSLPTVNSRGAIWSDFNLDGRLDLFVGGYEIWQQKVHPDVIYLNQSDGTFEEVWRSPEGACYSARGVVAADLNEDGRIDVFVSNYRLQPNHLWINQGEGEFEEVAKSLGAAGQGDGGTINYTGGIQYLVYGHTIGSALGDLDDDGHLDIFVGNFSHPRPGQDHPQFLRNLGAEGEFKFEDRSEGAGLSWQESFASAALGDYDNDGDLDLYFTTVYGVGSGNLKNFPVLYANQGAWKFKNTTRDESLPDLPPTYQSAWADLDNDGDLDLCTAGRLFRNDAERGNWIELQLAGNGTQVSRSAFGAVARIRIGKRVLTRFVEPSTGEGNQSDSRLHFGLGEHQEPVMVEITWPGGQKQLAGPLTVGQQHRVAMQCPAKLSATAPIQQKCRHSIFKSSRREACFKRCYSSSKKRMFPFILSTKQHLQYQPKVNATRKHRKLTPCTRSKGVNVTTLFPKIKKRRCKQQGACNSLSRSL